MDTSKLLSFFENARHIALLLPEEADFDCLASAEVLVGALQKKGKQVGFLYPYSANKKIRPEIFPQISSSPALPKEFVVSLDTSSSAVAQLRYEKEADRIDIVFSPKDRPLSQNSVSFREGKMLCDAAVAIGVTDVEDLKNIPPQFPTQTPILNIDNTAENKSYGEVNLVNPEKLSRAEIVYEALAGLASLDTLGKDSATLILAAVLSKTANLASPATAPDTLICASELMRLGAELKSAQELWKDPALKSPNLVQLLGRASVRSRFDENSGILWSFLTAEDFEKTQRTPQDAGEVLGHLVQEFPPHRIAALLWQNPEDRMIHATLAGERRALEILEEKGSGTFQSPYLLINASFQSFREAEEIVGSLLENINHHPF